MTTAPADIGITSGTWNIDPAHSEVTFVIRHLMTKVRGTFTEFSGKVVIADDLQSSTVSAEVDMNSVDTRNSERDAHIRSADIFDVANHPSMTFATTGVRVEDGAYVLAGDLSIKGVTRPVTFDLEFNGVGTDPWGGTRAGFSAATRVSRKDFDIDFNIPLQGDKALLGDKVDIQLEVQAVLA